LFSSFHKTPAKSSRDKACMAGTEKGWSGEISKHHTYECGTKREMESPSASPIGTYHAGNMMIKIVP